MRPVHERRGHCVALAAVLATVTIAAVACGGSAKPAASPKSNPAALPSSPGSASNTGPVTNGSTLTVGLAGDTDGWNPLTDQWSIQGYYVAQTIFEPLMGAGVGPDGKPVLHTYLARSVSADPSNQHWTITLPAGIRFSDGESLDASAVALQINMVRTSPAGALFGNNLIQGATAVDPTTVRVDLTQPDVAFEQVLATQIGYIAAPRQLRASASDSAAKPIGSGPFKMNQWVPDDHLSVVRNPLYYRQDAIHLDSIVFKVIPDDNTRSAAMQSGQIDFTYPFTAAMLKQFAHQSGITEVQQPPVAVPSFIALNTAKAPLNDVHLRQALSYATDPQQYINTLGLGYGQVASEPYVPGQPWYSPSGYPAHPDLIKAKALVAQYRADSHTNGPIKLDLQCLANQTATEELWVQQWSKIGVQATFRPVEYQTLVSNVISRSYQAACFSLFGALPDPDGDFGYWLSSSLLNFSGLTDPQIDHDLLVGRTAPSAGDPVRQQVYRDVWQQLATEVPYLWLTWNTGAVIYNPKVVHFGVATLPDGSPWPQLTYGFAPIAQSSVSH